ncbi:SDR family oxidoreductase [Pelomonas sp. KK5]|uniref:SDR family oxidoreductase n=1 Tax=Pelomonas sp. KK5 TaxID=1855730 RepID=UPI00097C5A1C|nr:SDR family oxidoreductase [Pelomonas sp. KK5]
METGALFGVAGKRVLITGASSGLGLMMAEGFVKAGANVSIVGRRAQPLEAAREALERHGEVDAIECDLGTADGVAALVATLQQRDEPLHVLVNNAGTAVAAPFDSYPDDAWPELMALNVQVPFMLAQRLLPLMERAASEEDPARIINIGSVAGLKTSSSNTFAYGPSKAALHQLTRSLARELAPRRILVNAIAPGFFPSNMSAPYLADEQRRRKIVQGIPLGRTGEASDISGLAIFLSSRAGAFVTGTVIPLDGGMNVL